MNTTTDPLALNFTLSQRIPLGIYCLLSTLLGLFGNATVIYASLRYNAIDMDRITVLLIQNLAIADTLYTLITILPQTITTIAGRYLLGGGYCFIQAQLPAIPTAVNTLTVAAITTYKLRIVTHPFNNMPQETARGMVAGIWVVSLTGVVLRFSYRSYFLFVPNGGYCMSSIYFDDSAKLAMLIYVILLLILPLLVITLSNGALCVVALRSARRLEQRRNYKALVTVCALSGLFLLSWLPWVVNLFVNVITPTLRSQTLTLLALHCMYSNAFGNPILYTLTNRRFGTYAKRTLVGLFKGQGGAVTAPRFEMLPMRTALTAQCSLNNNSHAEA